MAMRGPRVQVGSGPWINEERSCALQIVQSEVEEFSFSARNELDWLNEHMAGIFDENQTYDEVLSHARLIIANVWQEHRRSFQNTR
jgi:hypothetical protein